MKSTSAQRSFISKLAGNRKMSELETILAPAFRINGNNFNVYDTLTQNTNRLTAVAASRCIDLLKNVEA